MPINTCTLVGNLTRDPELKALPSGTQVCELGVAVNERVKGQNGQWEDRPSFFDVTVFGGQAEATSRHLAKGSPVAISGRLRQERWQDQQGQNRSRVKIVANDVQFIGRKAEPMSGEQSRQAAQNGGVLPQAGGWGEAPPAQQGPHTDPSDDIGF